MLLPITHAPVPPTHLSSHFLPLASLNWEEIKGFWCFVLIHCCNKIKALTKILELLQLFIVKYLLPSFHMGYWLPLNKWSLPLTVISFLKIKHYSQLKYLDLKKKKNAANLAHILFTLTVGTSHSWLLTMTCCNHYPLILRQLPFFFFFHCFLPQCIKT